MTRMLGVMLFAILLFAPLTRAGDVSLGAKLGLADPEDLDTALDLGVLIRGKLTPAWRVEGSLEYWGVNHWKDVSLNGAAAYEIPVSGTVKPYLGFGTGAHIQSWSFHEMWWHDYYWVDHSESRTFLGLHLLGGADFDLSPQTKIITELKYAIIPDDAGLDALTITGGVAIKLR